MDIAKSLDLSDLWVSGHDQVLSSPGQYLSTSNGAAGVIHTGTGQDLWVPAQMGTPNGVPIRIPTHGYIPMDTYPTTDMWVPTLTLG